MFINLKDFVNANTNTKAELENDLSSEVLNNAEAYFMFLTIAQHNGVVNAYIFKNDDDVKQDLQNLATKLIELQAKARGFTITDEKRIEWGELEQELSSVIDINCIESFECGNVDAFSNNGLVVLC